MSLDSLDTDALRGLMAELEGLSPEEMGRVLSRVEREDEALYRQFLAVTLSAKRYEENRQKLDQPPLSTKIKQASATPRVQHVAETLTQLSSGQMGVILGGLGVVSPALAEAIKLAMFSFDDLVYGDPRGLQLLLSRVDKRTLRYALRSLEESVADALYAQLSKRAAAQLREDVELMGPVRRREVMDARKAIVALARGLISSGELIIIRPGDADEWVL